MKTNIIFKSITTFIYSIIMVFVLSTTCFAEEIDNKKILDLSYNSYALSDLSSLQIEYPYYEKNRIYIQQKEDVYYYYGKLDEKQKQLYNSLYKSIIAFDKQTICIDGVNEEEYLASSYKSLQALLNDRPIIRSFVDEIVVFSDNKFIIKLTDDLFGKKVTLKDLKNMYNVIESKVDNIVNSIPYNLTVYGKYVYLADKLCEINDYDYTTSTIFIGDKQFSSNYEVQTAYSVFYTGKSVCEGYALAYQYLCNKAGLWCLKSDYYYNNEEGTVVGHSFNLIDLFDGTYYVDTTWIDGNNNSRNYKNFVFTKENSSDSGHELFLQNVIEPEFISTGKAYIQ